MSSFLLPNLPVEIGAEEPLSFGSLESSFGNLPLKQLHYHAQLKSLICKTTITQVFYNVFNECVEASYVFPLHHDQAVVGCKMCIGDRVIHADLQERSHARANYQRAIRRGHRAALLEENRSECFSMRVGNMAPGEAIQIRLETIHRLGIADGEWTLRLPLVVAPRYTSGFALPGESVGNGIDVDTDEVPDASTVTPPRWADGNSVSLPGFASPVDLRLRVDIVPGILSADSQWLSTLRSSLHTMAMTTDQPECDSVRLDLGEHEQIDRDFILRGRLGETSVSSRLTLEPDCRERRSSKVTFALDLIAPPVMAGSQRPCDVVFLLDRSGSMNGWKMRSARDGVGKLVQTLSSQDRFEVIAFDDEIESVFDGVFSKSVGLQDATPTNVARAAQRVRNIDARGSTEMKAAVQTACDRFAGAPKTPGDQRNRCIVLVTDGQITGEDFVLQTLGRLPTDQCPRLFCLGVDTAVNGGLLERFAKATGGLFEVVETPFRLTEVLDQFANHLASPALSNVEVELKSQVGRLAEVTPAGPQTVYAGRMASFYGQIEDATDISMVVNATLPNGDPWCETYQVSFDSGASDMVEPVLLPAWGRARIRQLEDQYALKDVSDEMLRNQIVRTSLHCQVLSRFTAYVAIDESEVVNFGGRLHAISQPAATPAGWAKPFPRLSNDALIACWSAGDDDRYMPPLQPVAERQYRENEEIRKSIADTLIQEGTVSLEQYNEAEGLAKERMADVADMLVLLEYATGVEVAKVRAATHRLPFIDLTMDRIEESILELIPASVARENCVIPVHEDGSTLTIALSNPTDLETVEKLRFILNRPIDVVLASPDHLNFVINRYYQDPEGESAYSMLQEFTDTAIDFTETEYESPAKGSFELADGEVPFVTFGSPENDLPHEHVGATLVRRRGATVSASQSSPMSGDAPIVRLVNLMLAEAVALRASEIRITPDHDRITVVYCIDGKQVARDSVARAMLTALITRFKILAKISLEPSDDPESGVARLTVGDKPVTADVTISPTIVGPEVRVKIRPQVD